MGARAHGGVIFKSVRITRGKDPSPGVSWDHRAGTIPLLSSQPGRDNNTARPRLRWDVVKSCAHRFACRP